MALKDPRATKFKIGWHREPTSDGTPKWYAEIGGVRVAEAAMTGAQGRDHYPWEWYLTDAGEGLRRLNSQRRSTSTAETLRECKDDIDYIFRPAYA